MSTPVCLLNEPCTNSVDLESLRRLDGLYAFYHEHWWCKLQMFTYFKKCNAILNGLALLTMATSIVVGSVWAHSYVAVGLTAFATLVKGWNDFKKYSFKMDMSKFAYTSYEKALGELRNYALRHRRLDRTFDQDANDRRCHRGFHISDRRSIRAGVPPQVSSRSPVSQ